MPDFSSAEELLALCRERNVPISRAMLERETELFGTDGEAARKRMADSYRVMRDAIRQALDRPRETMGGLIGGEAIKLTRRAERAKPLCGGVTARAVAYAMGVLEINASMGLIVAAPTAGSSGVIPGAFVALQEEFGYGDEAVTDALFTAAAVGYLFMRNAFISGARGGCQAEIGAASAMAAAGAAELAGAEPRECLSAAAIAITNLLGLVCDPICGLVEEPCQKRNGMGVANALVSAEMVLAGIAPVAGLDDSIQAMRDVGLSMPRELRETALGGIAATPGACRACERMREESRQE